MDALKGLWAKFKAGPVWRAWQRYSAARGNLLAGGVTYFAFFSIFPAVALAFTVFGLVLRDQPELLAEVHAAIEQQLPGFVQTEDNPDGLIPVNIPSGATLSISAAIGVAGILWAGLGWLGALRDGIRTIFGAEGAPGNFVLAKLRDLLVLASIGVGIVLAAVTNTVTSAVAGTLAEAVGLGDQTWIITWAGLLVSFLANGLLVALMLRVLSGVDLPWAGTRNGALFGGVAMTLLQTFSARLLAGTMGNKLFASIALVVGLLAFLNFVSRAMLLSAAWAANDLDTLRLGDAGTSGGEDVKLREGPATREQAAAELAAARRSRLPADATARAAVGLPTLDARDRDRASVAAGVVLGAAGATLAGMAMRLGRLGIRRR